MKQHSLASGPLLCLCLLIGMATPHPGQGQPAASAPLDGPNHFILLVDASGTVRDNGDYAAFLRNEIVPRLYEGGLAETLPAFDPARDALTLLHFGICPHSACLPVQTAYRKLARYDLTDHLVHPVEGFIRRENVTAAELQRRIQPQRYYTFTALSWAEPVALWKLRAPDPAFAANRTFLLAITDGLYNDNTVQQELRTLRRNGNAESVEQTERRVNAIDAAYMLSDGADEPGEILRLFYPDEQNRRYFVEAFEVIPQQALAWKQQVAALDQSVRLSFGWTDESDEQPQGVFRGRLSRPLLDLIAMENGGRAWLRLDYEGQTVTAEWPLEPTLEVPVTMPGPLTREPRSYRAQVYVSTVRQDSLLGRQAVTYAYPVQPVATPVPTRYTLPPLLLKIFLWSLAIGLLLLVAYCLYYRFYTTHLEIELPGKLAHVRLKRGQDQHDVAYSNPHKDRPALTLRTPRWIMAPFYKGATLTLTMANHRAAAYWSTPDGPTTELKKFTNDVNAFWERIDPKPLRIKLHFKQGSQESVVTVSYPHGDMSSIQPAAPE